ncbi:MAG: hypothetical protein ACR2MO_10440 [Acidimicrobiales bacterium]
MRTLTAGAAGRAVSGIGDQVLSSASNFAVTLVAARTLTPAQFGLFSIAMVAYLIVLGVTRSVSGETLVARYSAADSTVASSASAAAAAVALTGGVIGAAVCFAVGTGLSPDERALLWALALVLPGLMLQDAWRWVFFALGRPEQALWNDVVWVAGLVVAFTIVTVERWHGAVVLVLAWGVTGCVAAGAGLWQNRSWPALKTAGRWLHANRTVASRFAGEFVAGSGMTLVASYAVVAFAGGADFGRYRAGMVLMAPLNVLFIGVHMYGVPEGVRAHAARSHSATALFRRVSVGLALSSILVGAVAAALPDVVGEAILGRNWLGAQALVLPLSVGYAGFGLATGAMASMRASGAYGASLRARVASSALITVGTVAGAMLSGASGAAIGGAGGSCAGAALWWRAAGLSRSQKASAEPSLDPIPHHR